MVQQSSVDGKDSLAVTLEHVLRSMEAIGVDVREVREEMIALKNSGIGRSVDDVRDRTKGLEGRVDLLEADRDRRDGSLATANWASKYLPWLLTALASLIAAASWVPTVA